jgi:hypothetical protein
LKSAGAQTGRRTRLETKCAVNEHPLSERSPARIRHRVRSIAIAFAMRPKAITSSRTRCDVMIPFRTPGHLSFNHLTSPSHWRTSLLKTLKIHDCVGQFMPAIAAKLCVKSQTASGAPRAQKGAVIGKFYLNTGDAVLLIHGDLVQISQRVFDTPHCANWIRDIQIGGIGGSSTNEQIRDAI